jgi:5-methylcytosine-specific restriction protein B
MRVIQFHPSLSYEDFVRGWRPHSGGTLELVDGIFLQAIRAAIEDPRPFVLIIEEVNRGNPSQVFGEILTLLENTKRSHDDALELAYRRPGEKPTYIPDNLHLIGTMNIADRSLALVDLALRRRFAFVGLEPRLTLEWQSWCLNHGLDQPTIDLIQERMTKLNQEIEESTSLGPQFRVGHSYVTPDKGEQVADGREWFRRRVLSEIGPLLEEYWYDNPKVAKQARDRLLDGIG